jgi:cytochrome oxidase Cu insertion factor (SCO1/SenC/PrrC family)
MIAFDINYKEESKFNYEFVQAVRDNLRDEPKRHLHQWGEDMHNELKAIDFTTKTNKKSSKEERANHYGIFLSTFNELKEVATKVSVHDIFEFKGNKLSYYQESA